MSNFWMARFRRVLNILKMNSIYLRTTDKANSENSVTRLGYGKVLQHSDLHKNYISALRLVNVKEQWNDFSLKELLRLNIREASVVSTLSTSKNPLERLGIIHENVNFSVSDENGKSTEVKNTWRVKDDAGKIIKIREIEKKHNGKRISSTSAISLISILLNSKATEIKQEIMNHPQRNKVSAKQITDSYYYLIEKGYNNEAIKGCPTILFYHKDNIEKTLKFLESEDFKDRSNSTADSDLKLRLHMCMYHIEKQYHFSGKGLFPPDDVEKI